MFSNELICNVLDYIDRNIYDEIKINDIVNIFYFNRTYIMKRFKKEIGISIIDYSHILRIYNSLTYFKDDKKILEIALKNGFNSQEYYTEIFKKVLGVSPVSYKKYISFISKIDHNKVSLIQKKLLNIENILNKVKKYKSNRKPKTMVKKLSLYNNKI